MKLELIMCRVQYGFAVILLIGSIFNFINSMCKGSDAFVVFMFGLMVIVCHKMLYCSSREELRDIKKRIKEAQINGRTID
ncbi:MAG: hypothetical protein NC044_05650 [Prevotella sp.]|nr:hypothetical protein [Lachnospiraceae bacterium]MCM1379525.1 hypothetical protein [Bacteroides sp.]MCM1445872.1 hypothetical protein [Prevotella sp.]